MPPDALSTIAPFNDGLYLGVNALPDSCLVVDCPVGCFFKCERIALNHDLTSTLYHPLGEHRIVQTGIDSGELPLGTADQVARRVREAVRRLRPAMVFVTEVSMTLMASNDLAALAASLEQELGLPVVHLPPDPFGGDFLDGYERFLEALAARLVAQPLAPRDEEAVAIVGYLPDRLEEDHRANLDELGSLIVALGARAAGIVCSGESSRELTRACRAGTIVSLPHGRAAARLVAAATGARLVEAELPIGLEGTARFLERVGEAIDRRDAARRLIEQSMPPLLSRIERARDRLLVDRVAVLAVDPHWATGLVGLFAELGLSVPLVAARTRHESRLGPLRAELARLALEPELVWDFDAAQFRQAVERVETSRSCDLIVGSSSERAVAHALRAGFVELGYPSYMTHALCPRPTLGFAGALRLADEIGNAASLRRHAAASGP